MSRIAIIGGGAWGTALALSLARRGGHELRLWSHSAAAAAGLARRRENAAYLPGFPVPEEIHCTADLAEALAAAEVAVVAVPSAHLREVFTRMAPQLVPGQVLVSATKGIEARTGPEGRRASYLRMTEVMAGVLAERGLRLPCGALSGPSFAQEVAAGLPAAVTIAFAESEPAARIQREFGSASLRLYTNDDVTGVELGGALKNVMALAAGITSGLGLGHNSVAALITRGIAEMTRLAVACGGRRETLAGLAGLGDLVLTSTGPLSRNRSLGVELGRGRSLAEAIAGLGGKVAEGAGTTAAALGLAATHGIEMPITQQMAAILHQGKSPRDALRELMARPGREED